MARPLSPADPPELTALPGIGPRLAAALTEVGIADVGHLRELGSVSAWRRLHPRFDCLNSLQALEAAVRGIEKRELDAATRQRLLRAFREASGQQAGSLG